MLPTVLSLTPTLKLTLLPPPHRLPCPERISHPPPSLCGDYIASSRVHGRSVSRRRLMIRARTFSTLRVSVLHVCPRRTTYAWLCRSSRSVTRLQSATTEVVSAYPAHLRRYDTHSRCQCMCRHRSLRCLHSQHGLLGPVSDEPWPCAFASVVVPDYVKAVIYGHRVDTLPQLRPIISPSRARLRRLLTSMPSSAITSPGSRYRLHQ